MVEDKYGGSQRSEGEDATADVQSGDDDNHQLAQLKASIWCIDIAAKRPLKDLPCFGKPFRKSDKEFRWSTQADLQKLGL